MNDKLNFKGCIFDLDGVIVDTAKYHFQSWLKLANSLNIKFTEEQNEHLKGVSRKESLDYILKLGNIDLAEHVKSSLCELKNNWYIELISHLSRKDLLPGVIELLTELKNNQINIALGSASKNAKSILLATDIIHFFDYIADGNSTAKSKPDPEIFLIASSGLNLNPEECIVFEDSIAGLEAAKAGAFKKIGIGLINNLPIADFIVSDLSQININTLNQFYGKKITTKL
ncbi:MAG TPA: beta-phosphoglucomutase [Saprospiraceae bacterium]|nr:beta-phosphoglucomutase [Saprospiraceae bacterium]